MSITLLFKMDGSTKFLLVSTWTKFSETPSEPILFLSPVLTAAPGSLFSTTTVPVEFVLSIGIEAGSFLLLFLLSEESSISTSMAVEVAEGDLCTLIAGVDRAAEVLVDDVKLTYCGATSNFIVVLAPGVNVATVSEDFVAEGTWDGDSPTGFS